MTDCEKLITTKKKTDFDIISDTDSVCDEKPKVNERDDLSGMVLNMFGKIDVRELIIIWVVFLFLHTEMFSEHVLKKFRGATNEDGTMTMTGTIYSSLFMILVVIICTLVF